MDRDFDGLYSALGRASIAPERLLRASLLRVIYTIRSERQLVEQIDFNLLFRWFVGLSMEHRSGLIADVECTEFRVRTAKPGSTVGADKNDDQQGFVRGARALKVTPHVAQKRNHSV